MHLLWNKDQNVKDHWKVEVTISQAVIVKENVTVSLLLYRVAVYETHLCSGQGTVC